MTIHKIDMDRLKTKPDAARQIAEHMTKRIERGFNIYWCDENPALFGQAIQRALLECPPDQWNVTFKPAYMPGETWQLVATRKKLTAL